MTYTNNAVQIKSSIIPAYERELAAAERQGDKEQVAAVKKEIARCKKLAGIKVKEDQLKDAPQKRDAKAEAAPADQEAAKK